MQAVPLHGGETIAQCVECGHIERDLVHGETSTRAHAWGGNAAFDRVRIRLVLRRLVRQLPRRPLRVLEIGFGDASLARMFESMGHDVSGIDPGLLERNVHWQPLRGRTWTSEAQDVELPRDHFDLILGIHVIEHLEHAPRVFANCLRTLRPGGRIYWITPSAESLGVKAFGSHWWNFEDPTHRHFYSAASITGALAAAGFGRCRARPLRLDSLSMEALSLLRLTRAGAVGRGVLRSFTGVILSAAVVPATLVARALVPRVAPSMEVHAIRPYSEPVPATEEQETR